MPSDVGKMSINPELKLLFIFAYIGKENRKGFFGNTGTIFRKNMPSY